jgi:DNA topoisomerase VI subunit B
MRCGIVRAWRRVLVSHRLSARRQEAGQVAVGLAGAVKFQGVTAAGQDVRGAQNSLTISAVTSLLWYMARPRKEELFPGWRE